MVTKEEIMIRKEALMKIQAKKIKKKRQLDDAELQKFLVEVIFQD